MRKRGGKQTEHTATAEASGENHSVALPTAAAQQKDVWNGGELQPHAIENKLFESERRIINSSWGYVPGSKRGLLGSPTVRIVIFLTIITAITRFYMLTQPPEIVFDEVHFGGFAFNYVNRQYFFDIHPPLGKLLLATVGYFVGFDNYSTETFKTIGNQFPDINYVYLRGVSSFFGTLMVPLVFLVCKEMGRSIPAALVAASFILFDGVILVTSRMIVTDSILWFFGILTSYTCLRLWNYEDRQDLKPDGGKVFFKDRSWWTLVFFCGIALGGVTSVKWTGLGFVGSVGIVQVLRALYPAAALLRERIAGSSPSLSDKKADQKTLRSAALNRTILFKKLARALFAGIAMIVIMGAFYYSTWVIHFNVANHTGPGDVWHDARFKYSLIGAAGGKLGAGQQPYTMWEKIIMIHKRMFEANNNLKGEHSYGSTWDQWPFMQKGMSYWTKTVNNQNLNVFLGGNAVAYAVSTPAVILFISYLISLFHTDGTYASRQWFYGITSSWILFGYMLNWLPYTKITRVCFLYHYVPCFYFAVLITALLLDKYFWNTVEKIAIAAAIITLAFGYWFFYAFETIYVHV